MAEREAASTTWVIQAEAAVELELVSCDKGHYRKMSHDGGVHVWPNLLVNLGSPEGRKRLHYTLPCFKAQVSNTSLGRSYT